MRLSDYFPESSISVIHSAKDWQEAIDFSIVSLLDKNYISENYIQAIKDSTINNGPYYILAPGVAMPHARPECGALKTGMSLTLLEQGVYFPGNDEPIKLLIGLSAADADSHIGAIQALSELLCEEEILEQLLTASSEKQLADIISRGKLLSPLQDNIMENKSARAKVQAFGGFLTAMVIPNIGAFIAWGFITALFIPTGWLPNEHFAKIVGPMITYLLPVMIGSTGGHLVGGKRGAVMGGIGTIGVIVGAEIPMFLGSMIMGPLGGLVIKYVDKALEKRIPAGFEMVINNFSLGIAGMLLCLLGFEVIGPAVLIANTFVKECIEALVHAGYLPLLSVINEPAKVLFLNNAIDQGVYYPLGMQQASVNGKSIFFMVASNPSPGLGLLLAFTLFGKGMSKRSAPGAMIIHFLGGIHELYFPYVLMKPLTIIAMIAGGMSGTWMFNLLDGGLVAGPSPGSIFAYLALTPKGSFLATIAGVTVGTLVSFAITSLILKMEKTVETESEDEFAQSANAVKAMKQEGAFSLSRVKRIAFVCDAGMGSSAMGATTFRKRLEKAGLAIEVKHYAIENVPADADIVVTHASLEGRVKRVTDKPLILINNYIGDPKLDTLFNQLTAEHKH